MTTNIRSKALGRLLRTAALGASVLLLAGCATGYSFVQPEVAGSGGYYTNPEPYTGQGYYDVYGTGPYYPGTSGWGYYNGTWPDSSIGWFAGMYGDYWSPFLFNVGFSNVWGFPGYWGPWYSVNIPIWGCGWDCGYWRRHWRHDGDHHHHGNTAHSWVRSNDPPDSSEVARNHRPSAVISQDPPRRLSVEAYAPAHRLQSASFAPHEFVPPARRQVTTGIGDPNDFAGAPARPPTATSFREVQMPPAYAPGEPAPAAFVNQRASSMPVRMAEAPRGFGGPVRAAPQGGGRAYSAAPASHVSAPSSHHDNESSHTEIR